VSDNVLYRNLSNIAIMSQNGTSLPLPARPNTACLAYSSGSSARAFAPRFFQTCPHASQPLRFAIPSTPSGFKEDLHLPVVEHARHSKTDRPWRRFSRPPRPITRKARIDFARLIPSAFSWQPRSRSYSAPKAHQANSRTVL